MGLTAPNPVVTLAANVLQSNRAFPVQQLDCDMNREFQIRFTAGVLVLLTVAAVTLAWINFRKEGQFVSPYDGVWWMERNGNVVADRVDPHGPGAQAGIKIDDRLTAINGHPVPNTGAVNYQLYQVGAWHSPSYSIVRGPYSLDVSPSLLPAQRSSNDWLRLIALT